MVHEYWRRNRVEYWQVYNTKSSHGDDDNDRSVSTEEKVGKRRVVSFISDNRRRDA